MVRRARANLLIRWVGHVPLRVAHVRLRDAFDAIEQQLRTPEATHSKCSHLLSLWWHRRCRRGSWFCRSRPGEDGIILTLLLRLSVAEQTSKQAHGENFRSSSGNSGPAARRWNDQTT